MIGFGERLGAWRRARHLTQAQLAEKLGVQTSAVGAYEIDRREPPLERLVAIADVLNVSLDRLLKGQPLLTDELESIQHQSIMRNEKLFMVALLKDAGYTVAHDAEQMIVITPPIPLNVNGKRRDFNATDNFPADELRNHIVELLKNAALPFAESYAKQFLAIVDFARAKAFGLELDAPAPNDPAVANDEHSNPNPDQPDARPDAQRDDRPDAPPDERPDDQHDENSARK